MPAHVIYVERSRFCPFLPYHNRPNPIQKAKPQGPAKSPIVLSTPNDASAKADAHCAIEASEAPVATINSRKGQNIFSLNN